MRKTSDMTLEQLQKRLREAHARIGFEGRFAFTIDQSAALSSGKGTAAATSPTGSARRPTRSRTARPSVPARSPTASPHSTAMSPHTPRP